MAHFAFVSNENIVMRISVISNDEIIDENGEEQESIGISRCIELYPMIDPSSGRWIQCSYNASFRGIYPGIGCSYSEEEDIFIYPQPFPSWIRDGSDWVSPIPMPQNPAPGWPGGGPKGWEWDEESTSWIAIEFPLIWDEDSQQWIPRNE